MAVKPKDPWNSQGVSIEVPPSDEKPDNCTENGCGNVSYSRGLCRVHYQRQYGNPRGRPLGSKNAPRAPEPPKPPPIEVTQEAVETMVVTAMQMLATTIDESFSALDIKQKPSGEIETMAIKPHVREAVSEMMPWMKIYGGRMMGLMPWFGLIGGCLALAAPAFEPVTEIIAGVRKPRLARRPRPGDPDLYTDEYKAAQRAREHKEAQKQANGAGQTRASDTIVEVTPPASNPSN